MAGSNMHGAAALRKVTPTGDNAPRQGRVEENTEPASTNLASKRTASALARLVLLGIEARHLHADTWALIASTGATIGIVRGAEALAAAAAGFEAVQADVLRALQRIGGAA